MLTLPDTTETVFSEIPLPPLKTLPTTSEGTRLTCANFPAPLLMLSINAETRLSDVVRNPWNTLVRLSDITDTELSEIERAPVKTLPTTSEGTRLTCANFPAPLLMLSLNAETRLSDVLRNPWNTLVRLSDITDTELSEIERAPVKTLPTTSEGTRLTCANFPAPLLMLSVNAATRLSDVLRNPVKALVTLSDTTDTELSEMTRAPVKTLPTTSEGTRLSSASLPAPLLTESVIETTSDRDFARPLSTTSEIEIGRASCRERDSI